LLNLYCSMLCIAFIIAVLLVETRCFCDSCLWSVES